jgi:outer membrane protein insertion porin family
LLKPHRFVPETVAAAALTAHGLTAHATAPFVVGDIRIEGLQRVELDTAFAYLSIRQGDTFTHQLASEAIHALCATVFFHDAQIATEGDIVIVHVVERPAVSTVDFSGLHEFDYDNPAKALRAVGLSSGRYDDMAVASKAEQELRRQYPEIPVPARNGILIGWSGRCLDVFTVSRG